MTTAMIPTSVDAEGRLRLPSSVRHALHLKRTGGLIGFVIQGDRVVLTKATVVPETSLSDEELAVLARWSKQGRGTRAFSTQDAALRHLWSL